MTSSGEQNRAELTNLCRQYGITVVELTSALMYATAAEPSSAVDVLREALTCTAFRLRSYRPGTEEAYVTVLDPIDRVYTIKIRRQLAA